MQKVSSFPPNPLSAFKNFQPHPSSPRCKGKTPDEGGWGESFPPGRRQAENHMTELQPTGGQVVDLAGGLRQQDLKHTNKIKN